MSHRTACLTAAVPLLATPAVALAGTDTSGGAPAAPLAQAAAGAPGSTPTPSSPGRERTGIVNVTTKPKTTHKAPSKPAAKPVAHPRPTAPAPAPVVAPRAAPRVTGTDGLPYTGGSPVLAAFCGLGFAFLGAGLRLRYGAPFRASRSVTAK